MKIAPVFDVGGDRYRWLRESLFVGEGPPAGPQAIEYELFRVTD